MKVSFEGNTIREVILHMREALAELAVLQDVKNVLTDELKNVAKNPAPVAQGPGPEAQPLGVLPEEHPVEIPVANPVDIPVEKPVAAKRERTEKQKANDERLRAAASAKAEAARAAKAAPATPPPVEKPAKADKPAPKAKAPEEIDPAKVVAIRQKTIEDLQSAYANGHQAEVFALLSKFGNGAKSFRELPPDAFMPIREAIDNGALT